MERNEKIKDIDFAIAKLEDEKYRIYKEWGNEITDLFSDNKPKYLKITRGGHDIYVCVKKLNGGVIGTPTVENFKKLVTREFICSNVISLLKHNDVYHLSGCYHFGIDTEFEVITKKEFDVIFADFVKTSLSPTKENVKWAYARYDLEYLKEKHPEYFDIDEVNFFIDRFAIIDDIRNGDNYDDFDEWL